MARKLIVALKKEEFYKLIKNTHSKKYRLAFLLAFGSGLRLSEVVGLEGERPIQALQPHQVNIKEKRITILGGKGNKDRVVPLPKGFKVDMLSLMPLDKQYKSVAAARRSIQKGFKLAAEKAGLLKQKPNLHFHSLRHSFATTMLEQGIPIHHVKNLMGHSNISTTNIYLVSNPEDALKSYEELF